jgi:DNA-binding NarL/FixJ family response regulator
MTDSVIIASNAFFLADALREKLYEASFKVFTASDEIELANKISSVYPRFIFLENCFHGYGTDAFIHQFVQHNRNIRIVVWTASEIKPHTAARFIIAGAESFFSLRDTYKNIEAILCRIAGGNYYYPSDVEAVLNNDCFYPVIGEELTLREIEIIKLSVSGLTNKQIGKSLSLSIHTVKFHKANIYRKCGGNTIVDILRNGVVRKIINLEDFE